MTKSVTNETLAASVEAALALPWHMLRFAPILERRYHEDTARSRVRHLTVTLTIGALLVMMFIVSDHMLIPDLFRQAVILRGFVTPILAALGVSWIRRTSSAGLRETIIVAMSVWVEFGVAYMTVETHSPYQSDYLAGAFLIMVYTNIVAQARFGYAVAATICSLAAVFGALGLISGVPAPVRLSLAGINITTSVLTLVANFQLERQARRFYLMTMREQLRNDDLASSNSELRSLSEEDPLTGIYNRRALDQRIDDLFKRSKLNQTPIGVIMVDVDHFKAYNDMFGHQAGDECLQAIAAILIDETRGRSDLLARYGGEEFILVVPRAALDETIAIAERIRIAIEDRAIPAPRLRETHKSRVVTASFGVATCDHVQKGPLQGGHAVTCPCTPADLIQRADRSLYAAKEAGRNRVHCA
jgi:diguanylate cyclase (GGDEF)-like protein